MIETYSEDLKKKHLWEGSLKGVVNHFPQQGLSKHKIPYQNIESTIAEAESKDSGEICSLEVSLNFVVRRF